MQKSNSPTSRNALRFETLGPERACICEAIRREIDLEQLSRTNRKREAWARMAIGLPPFPRTNYRERCRS